MKKNLVISLALSKFLILCQFASAETYTWSAEGHPSTFSSSPAASCALFVDFWNDNSGYFPHTWEYKFNGLSMPGQNAVATHTCWIERHIRRDGSSSSVIDYNIYRRGDSCPSGRPLNPQTGGCDALDVSKGEPTVVACKAEAINIANGNTVEKEVDLSNSATGLNFHRTYNAIDGVWTHSYSTRVKVSSGGVARITSSGQEIYYVVNGALITAPSYDLGKFSVLTDGWEYISVNNEVFRYDAGGRLTTLASISGKKQQLSYNGNVVTVTSDMGESLNFTEDENHQPQTLNAPGLSVQFSYTANNKLIRVSHTKGGVTLQREYLYEDPRNTALLTGIIDERGVRSATWTYDDQGRAITSQKADGIGLTSVAYNADGTRTVTNELGKNTLYRIVGAGGIERVGAIEGEPSANCPASNSTFTYNDRGQVLTQTDAKGFITTHTYNDRGLETTRTEATGTPQARTTTTIWHATFNLPLTITEGGQVTTYTYDSQGRQTSRTQTAL